MTAGSSRRILLLHYSAPPVIGGVENVILAHARLFIESGLSTAVVAGQGEERALPPGAEFMLIPELDSQHPEIVKISQELEQGRVPPQFREMTARIAESLERALAPDDLVITHNVFSKHFNLPLTAALFELLDRGVIRQCIAWCHDLTWTSPNSRSKVVPGYPWDLLRTRRADVTYVTISRERQQELADLFGCPPEEIRVIYNGVDPGELLALSQAGRALIDRLELWESDLNLLMPVRVTQAKNIELALQVTAALKRRGIRPRVVLTGPPDPHDPKNMEYFRHLLDLRRELDVVREFRFVYESGPSSAGPFRIDMTLVADLLRVSDALFMPSRREGFGMPVLEAGLAGLPVFCADVIPAASEIGGPDLVRFSPGAGAEEVAGLILKWAQESPILRLRRRVRQGLTWRGLFNRQIMPLLESVSS